MKALVTGGTVRVGVLICDVLREHGYEVVTHYNRSSGGDIQSDFSKGAQELLDNWPEGLSLLVNNASYFPEPQFDILTEPEDQIDRVMQISAWVPLKLIRKFAECSNEGRIIGILDTAVYRPFHKRPSHTLAKRTHMNVIEMAARELGPEILVQGLVLDKIIPMDGEDECGFMGAERFKELFSEYISKPPKGIFTEL